MPEILPPPEELLPEEFQDQVPLDQLRRGAQWAQTFRPSDTSWAQRFRHDQDIVQYGEALQERKAAKIEADARTNRVAQSFFFKDRELDAQAKIDQIKMGQAHELHGKKLRLMERQTSLAGERERTLAAKTDLFIDDAEQEEHETSQFTQEIRNSGTRIGTRERAEAVARAWEKFPGVEPTTFEQAWKMTRADKTPAEILAEVKAAREGLPTATVTGRVPGLTITDKPVVARDQTANVLRWEEELEKAKKSGDKELEALFTNRLAVAKGGSANQPKPLDKGTAATLLQEAGGDKEKARALAKTRGYTF